MSNRAIPKLAAVLSVLAAAICIFGAAGASAAATGDDYPSKWRDIPMDSVFDDWGMYNRECTSAVAWWLHERNGLEMPFHDNANGWGSKASARGFAVNGTPAVGAVAWWSSNHVAWVESVGAGVVTIEEYNHDYQGHYSRRTIPVGSPSGYIHFKDIGSGPPNPPPPPPPPSPPNFLPPGAINRYTSQQTGDHWIAGGGTPAPGYGFESTLGFAPLDPGEDRQTLYSCMTGGDQFVSPAPGCEGRQVLGPIGEVYRHPPPTGLEVVSLYRCTVNGTGDHFVSPFANCEGQHPEALLGFVTASQDRFNRYIVNGEHFVTARGVGAGAALESTLGFVFASGGSDRRAIFSCTTGGDQFTSPDSHCEGQHVIGLDGWIQTGPGSGWPPTSPLYRCTVNGNGEHFDSPSASCEGQHPEALLGYLPQTHPALDRFLNPSNGDHRITTRAVPAGYRFESRLGYMLQGPGPERHALYSCTVGSDQFTSPDPDCEGQHLIGLDGWVYDSAPAGSESTPVYRCIVLGTGDHFLSPSSGCEGQRAEALLGYVASTPAGAYPPVPGPAASAAAIACHVPRLKRLSLKRARAALRRSHCKLGKVTHSRRLHRPGRQVVGQSAKPQTRHRAGYPVNVTVA